MIKTNNIYTNRLLAQVVIQAETPLAVGSGDNDITTDSLVARDVNGLPYIPGSSIAGIIRHAIGEEKAELFFGKHSRKSDDCFGSEIIFSEARMIGVDGMVVDGLKKIDYDNSFYNKFKVLPIRQHAKISDKGITIKGGKFDEQVVYKGTRFVFEIEMVARKNDENEILKLNEFESVLKELRSDTFRVGSGTRCGFGRISIIDIVYRKLDLTQKEDLDYYFTKSSNLADILEGEKFEEKNKSDDYIKYKLQLIPEDFVLFGSGFGDNVVDMVPVKEEYIEWEDGKPFFVVKNGTDKLVLVPASSLKGAISHRTAYYYNQIKHRYSDDTTEGNPMVGNQNEAVKELFGYESQNEKKQVRGNVIFNDIILTSLPEQTLSHVSIDRFTGGAIESALFDEQTTFGNNNVFPTEILVKSSALKNEDIKKAFHLALKDIIDGLLPLGGGVNRGNGSFGGSVEEVNGDFKHSRKVEAWKKQ